jgi:phosphatidylinositol alpha-1,6-mannosyltransferase
MKIWLIAENWPPRIGGIENYVTGIAKHLEGHDVTVIAPRTSIKVDRTGTLLRKRFSWKPFRPAWLPLYLSLAKKARKEKPDVILCGKALVEGRVARLLKQKYGIPYVICTHGMEIASWMQRPKTRAQLVDALKDASYVTYVNKKTRQSLLELGVQEEHLMQLYPGIDTELLDQKQDTHAILKQYNIQPPYILTVSRLVERKGIDDLLEAYSLLDMPEKPSLVIVGDGPERKRLERHAQHLGIQPQFLGRLSDAEIHLLYTQAILFALTPKELPGDYEGFGIVYCEAAYFGLPIVATMTGGVPEAVQNRATGILAEPNHPKSIAQALKELLENANLRSQYGNAGRERVLQKFQWSTIITPLLTAITHL